MSCGRGEMIADGKQPPLCFYVVLYVGAARPTDISMRIHSYWWAGALFSSRSPAISHSQPDKPFAAWLGMADGWPGVWVAVGLCTSQGQGEAYAPRGVAVRCVDTRGLLFLDLT